LGRLKSRVKINISKKRFRDEEVKQTEEIIARGVEALQSFEEM